MNPATLLQKEKLRFFGCTWDGDISYEQAEESLLACVVQFPEKENQWNELGLWKKYQEQLERQITPPPIPKIRPIPNRKSKSVSRLVLVVSIIFGGIWFLWVILTLSTPTLLQSKEFKFGIDEEIAAERAIKNTLLAPRSAKFQWERAYYGDNGAFVFGYVDSQNAFGALLRKRCAVQFKKSGYSWEIIDTYLGDRAEFFYQFAISKDRK
jgi:hypothetical protein